MNLKPETLTPDTIIQLQTLIQADPALIAQLQSCTDAASSAAVIVKAAAAKGIDVSTPVLAAHFEAAAAKQEAMSDAELEQVAGGGKTGSIIVSIFTVGIVCAILSAQGAIISSDCKSNLDNATTW